MEQAVTTPNGSRRNEDIALDLLKFVAASAGLGKGTSPAAGFVAATGSKPEDQVNPVTCPLLEMPRRCPRKIADGKTKSRAAPLNKAPNGP